jgi:flagellar biosynthesis/type III secretory pathway protein FliH
MKTPAARRVELHAERLKRIALSKETDFRRMLLAECAEEYTDLDPLQAQELQALIDKELYREARPLMITTYQRGKAEGKAEGIAEGIAVGKAEGKAEGIAVGKAEGKAEGIAEGKAEGKAEGIAEGKIEARREMALILLEAKFGSLSSPTQQRIAEMTFEELRQLVVELVKGNRTSLQDLQLEE